MTSDRSGLSNWYPAEVQILDMPTFPDWEADYTAVILMTMWTMFPCISIIGNP